MNSWKRKPLKKNKKGMSVIIGYVLLITFGLVLSVIVFNYLKTYVPKDSGSCPDGVSIFLESYSCSNGVLNITLKNNGRFNYPAYSIHVSNNPNQTIAFLDLSGNLSGASAGFPSSQRSFVFFDTHDSKFMRPQTQVTHIFKYSTHLYSIEITPVIFQKIGSTGKFVRCSNAISTQKLNCTV